MFHKPKQTAHKTTGGSVGPYSMAGHRIEDKDEDLEEEDDEDLEQEADDDSMASDNERVQDLRQKLDLVRDKLDSELDKGTTRDKELVLSYERRVEDMRAEIDGILKSTTGQSIVQAIKEHGDSIVNAINDGIANEINEQGAEILEVMRSM